MKLSSGGVGSKWDRLRFRRQKMSQPELKSVLYFIALSSALSLPFPALKFNCSLNLEPGSQAESKIRRSNLFEICRVEMKRKIAGLSRWALCWPNWILCNAKLNQNTIFIVSPDEKSMALRLFFFSSCKYPSVYISMKKLSDFSFVGNML